MTRMLRSSVIQSDFRKADNVTCFSPDQNRIFPFFKGKTQLKTCSKQYDTIPHHVVQEGTILNMSFLAKNPRKQGVF